MPNHYTVNRENARWRVVDGEAVVINLATSHYYSLNRTGTFIWNLLAERELGFDEILDALASRYRQVPDSIEPDLRRILDDLNRESLLLVR